MKRLVKIRHRYFTAGEDKNNKCGTNWGLTGGTRSLFFRLNSNRSTTRLVLISLDEVVLERGLHINHDQFLKSVARLKTVTVKAWYEQVTACMFVNSR